MTQRATLTRADEVFAGNAQQSGYRADGGPGVRLSTVQFVDLGVPVTASATAISNGVTTFTNSTVVLTSGLGAIDVARNLTMVAGTTAHTQVVRVEGEDVYGQPMIEDFTLNGTTAVVGVKAFKEVTRVTIPPGAAASTVNIGIGDRLGLPFRLARSADVIGSLLVDNIVNTTATFVTGLATTVTSTAGSSDVRGYVTPTGTLANNARRFTLMQNVSEIGDTSAAFGVQQFRG